MVFHKGGIFRKDRAFARVFHISLKRHQSFTARLVEQVVHGLERIEVALLAELRAAKGAGHAGSNLFEDVQRIGHQHRADGCTSDNQQFRRLQEHLEVAVLHQVPACHSAKNYQDANNGEH